MTPIRTGLTADDTALTDLSTAGLTGAGLLAARFALPGPSRPGNNHFDTYQRCDTPAATIKLVLVLYGPDGAALTECQERTIVSGPRTDGAGHYLCPRVYWDVDSAFTAGFLYVTSLSAGTWDLYGRSTV